jgi:hypothetical protein
MTKLFYRIKRKITRTFFSEQWSLLICNLNGEILRAIVPSKDRFWADPFPVEHDGKNYIFIEQQIGAGSGTLGYIELYPDLSHSGFIPILEKPYHLSFPFIFNIKKDNERIWYMIPETHENMTIDLYRAKAFPKKWVFEMTLMHDVKAVDSIVFYHNDYWWLFTSIGKGRDTPNKNLSLFYADVFPTDAWKPHPQNPLCSVLENSRMAGAVFLDKKSGVPCRPAQNCLRDYGQMTNINEITEVNPSSYKERLVKTILPEKNMHAVCTHTVNFSEHYMLRDIKTRTLRFFP